MRLIFALFILLFTASNSYSQTCLSYKEVGYANCKKKEKEVKKELPPPPPPPPVVVAPPPVESSPVVEIKPVKELTEKEKLDLKVEKEVDEFLKNHGKPPREFATFMINPTLENALIWAQKYNDDLKRTEETTVAWMKAQYILKEQKEGKLNMKLPEIKKKRRTVPDYNLQWSVEENKFLPIRDEKEGEVNLEGEVITVSSSGSITGRSEVPENTVEIENPDIELRAVFEKLQQQQNQAVAVKSERNAVVPKVENAQEQEQQVFDKNKIYVSYYFSAECPYCKKFEPGFQQIITELGEDKISVTCVDMTPSKKDIVNIYGKIDCDWRPLMPGEMKAFGIKTTPTILVNFPGKEKVERLEGFVDENTLRNYLKI